MATDSMRALLDILKRLEAADICCRVTQYREDAVSIEAYVPGQHWEIDVLCDGTIDVEVYKSDGKIHDVGVLDAMIAEFSD